MARKKLERVPDLEKAKTRAAGAKSISPTLDLGNGTTLVAYQAVIDSETLKLAPTTHS